MQHIAFIQEDHIVIGTRADMWEIFITDSRTGKRQRFIWDDEQLASVLTVMLQGDNANSAAWEIAEQALEGVIPECRVIP